MFIPAVSSSIHLEEEEALVISITQYSLMSGGIKDPCLMTLMKWKIFLESSLAWVDPQEDQGSDILPHRVTQGPDLPIPQPPSITENHTPTSHIGDIRIQKHSEHSKLNQPHNILLFVKTPDYVINKQ